VLYRDLGALDGDELDALIARQVDIFRRRREPFEWKLHGHDRPEDLHDHLIRAGFAPEARETVVMAPVDAIAQAPQLPDGVTLRSVSAREDLERIARMEHAVWDDDRTWIPEALEAEREADPAAIEIYVAEAAGEVVSAGWVRFVDQTEFATLWGGSTLPAFRGRGIYKALVAERACLAKARGARYLQVDASDDSRPILERLGFVPLTTTTPYIWSP
jgi:GNAT superfamily N-acetyltransferase